MWDFEHAPEQARLAERYSIHRTTPANCAAELASGAADIGLIPAAAYALQPELAIIPGCAIAALGRVRSILLVVRAGGVESVRSVAADTSSLTSVAYTQVLFRRYWQRGTNGSVNFIQHPPDLDLMLRSADAALLIGDVALLALEDAPARLKRTGERLDYRDLAYEWRQLTGLAWVSAFWAVRPAAIARAGYAGGQIFEDFQGSRDHGLSHIEALVAEWSPRISVPPETIRAYLTRNIHYLLDEQCMAGLRGFYQAAAECRVLPSAPELRFL